MKKERITIEDLEKMSQSKFICTAKINFQHDLFGDNKNHILTFDIFDGFAYCADYNGKEYWFDFPRLKFSKESTILSKQIIEFNELEGVNDIKVIDVMSAFAVLSN